MMRILLAIVAVSCWLIAVPVQAQSAYVTGAVGADVVRVSGASTGGGPGSGGNGEVLSGALRLGTSLGDRWGVELELGVPGRLESGGAPSGIVMDAFSNSLNVPGASVVDVRQFIVPSIRAERRNVTVSSAIWIRQRVSDSASLAYVGGLGFFRVTRSADVSFSGGPLPALILPVPRRSRSVSYGVGPVVGMEGRIALTDHVRLVPSLRLHVIDRTWLLRPTVGLGWAF